MTAALNPQMTMMTTALSQLSGSNASMRTPSPTTAIEPISMDHRLRTERERLVRITLLQRQLFIRRLQPAHAIRRPDQVVESHEQHANTEEPQIAWHEDCADHQQHRDDQIGFDLLLQPFVIRLRCNDVAAAPCAARIEQLAAVRQSLEPTAHQSIEIAHVEPR